MLLALLLALPLSAQEGSAVPDIAWEASVPEEPLPVHGDPWDLRVTAYLLPPQDPAWLTSTDPFRSCLLAGTLAPGQPAAFDVRDCPGPMVEAARAAAAAWRFEPSEGAEPAAPTRFELRFVVRYAEQLATMTTFAVLDPGAELAFAGAEGVPGVKLVHPAALVRVPAPRVPRAARKAGVGAQPCAVAVVVGPAGDVRAPDASACPEPLAEAAARAALRGRCTPRVVDGMTEEQPLTVEVRFR